jgi:hypothetical protein
VVTLLRIALPQILLIWFVQCGNLAFVLKRSSDQRFSGIPENSDRLIGSEIKWCLLLILVLKIVSFIIIVKINLIS